MMQTAEQVFETVRSLSSGERDRLFSMLENERMNGNSIVEKRLARDEQFRLALKWVDENRKEYDGQFVLLDGDTLLDHGTDPKKLYNYARQNGIEIPFVKRIKAEILPFGGW